MLSSLERCSLQAIGGFQSLLCSVSLAFASHVSWVQQRKSLFIRAAERKKKQGSPSIMNGVQPPAASLGGSEILWMCTNELAFFVFSFHHPRPAMILTQDYTNMLFDGLNPLMLKQLNHSLDFQSSHMKPRWSDLVIITRASDGKAAENHCRGFHQTRVTSVPFHWSPRYQIIGKITNSLSSCLQNHASNSHVFCRINEKQPNSEWEINVISQINIDL